MRFRRSDVLSILAVWALTLGSAACPPKPPKPPKPTPTPPDPVCQAGQNVCCWHQPPGNPWLFACPAPNAPGGVVSVAGGPAQCIPSTACAENPNPNPTPTPTPKPTPPPSGDVPPKGQPVMQEALLRVKSATEGLTLLDGTPFVPFGVVSCCEEWKKCPEDMAPSGEPFGAGWPVTSACFEAATRPYGNKNLLYHWRLMPWFADAAHDGEVLWSPIGGAYNADGSWNAAFWAKVRELAWRIGQQGGHIEVAPIDDWWLKNATGKDNPSGKTVPWPQSAVDAWGKQPEEWARKAYTKAVEELGCYGFVHFVTGNEEDLIAGMTAAHVQWRIDTMRQAFHSVGCGLDHIIGSGSFKQGIGNDYQITHQESPVTGPCGPNRLWCYDNESNDSYSADQRAHRDQQALQAKQSFAAWRASASDPEWERQLELYKANRGGGPPPATGCYAPDGNDPLWQGLPNLPPLSREVSQAYENAKAAVGNRCGATGQCTDAREPCSTPIFLGCQDTSDMIAAEMRKQGLCVSGSWGGGPEVAVLDLDNLWKQLHPCSTGDGCYTGQAYKAAWKYNGVNPSPGPVPTPTPTPTPTPPPSGSCTNPPAPTVDHWYVYEHNKGPNKTIVDSTPQVHDRAYCASIGFTDGRLDCPVRMEGDPLAVVCTDEAVGAPVWVTLPPQGRVSPENSYQAWVPRGVTGTAKVCASKTPTACGSVQVTP